MATRRANNGNLYTLLDFQGWYGFAQGTWMWEKAGAQEPGAAAEVPDAQQAPASAPTPSEAPAGAADPGTASDTQQPAASPSPPGQPLPSAPTATDAPAGAAELGRDEIAPILFAPTDMDRFRAEGATYARGQLHNAARQELERWISRGQDVVGDRDPDEHAIRFPWQAYVAMHPRANDLVGPSIIAFEANFIAGTTDPNRGGQQRLDFVIRHTYGGYVRIRPGSKPQRGAIPK